MKFTLYPALRQVGLVLLVLLVIACPCWGQVITTYAGTGVVGYFGDGGPALSAKLDSPSCLAADGAGNLYINDQKNSCVRKISPSGIISTVAGTGVAGWGGDGGAATNAQMTLNWGMAVDGTGNIYITDQGNYRVRKVDLSGTIHTICGNSSYASSGDGGQATAASLKRPIGIAVDVSGNIYIGDQDAHKVRRINPAGIITTVAGNGTYGFFGDGGLAVLAELSNIWGLATDATGNLYICDGENNRIRKVSTTGIITTVAGNGFVGSAGDGGQATNCNLNQPTGVFVTADGTIYISDSHNNRIRQVNPAGIVHTIAGIGVPAFGGDNGPATAAKLFHPSSVIVGPDASIFIADLNNVRIRRITENLRFTKGRYQPMLACENASSLPIDSLLGVEEKISGLTLTWNLVTAPSHGTANASYVAISSIGTILPSGLTYTPVPSYIGYDTFTVSVTDGIARDTTTIYVTVTPILPSPGIIVGDSVVCVGSSIDMEETVPGGIWSITNLNAIVNSGVVTGQSPGPDTVRYTVTNACGTASTSKKITVFPVPNAGSIAGPTSFCINTSITLSDPVTNGTWSSANTDALVAAISATDAQVLGIHAGADTIFYTVADSVCSSTAMHVINIEGIPDAGTITGPDHVCIQSQIVLKDAAPGGVWSVSNTNASFIDDADSIVITGLVYGTDTVKYKTSNSCGSDSAQAVVNIDLVPSVPAISFKEGTLYAPAGYPKYQWTIGSQAIPGAVVDSYDVSVFGSYAVIVTNLFGCSAVSAPIDYEGCSPDEINVYPNPAPSIVYIDWCKKVTVKLLCMDGKEVSIYEHVDHVDLSGLPDAAYMLEIFDDKGHKVKSKRVIKK